MVLVALELQVLEVVVLDLYQVVLQVVPVLVVVQAEVEVEVAVEVQELVHLVLLDRFPYVVVVMVELLLLLTEQ